MKEESELLVVFFFAEGNIRCIRVVIRKRKRHFFLGASRDVLSIRGYWDYHEDLGRWE